MALTPNESGNSQSQPVTFTSKAADRIAKVVRRVEAGNRDQLPTVASGTFLPQKHFRVCTFTGSWSIDAVKTVTFRNVTTTPNTVSAMNLFAAVTAAAGITKNCAIAKDGTSWYLIAAQC